MSKVTLLLLLSWCVGVCLSAQVEIAHITDLHWDWDYTTGGHIWELCRKGTTGDAKQFGNVVCAAPYTLVEQTVLNLRNNHNPKVVMWMGDTMRWAEDPFSDKETVINLIANITALLKATFPDAIVIPQLGNHDVIPAHQMEQGPNYWLYDQVLPLWVSWLPAQAEATFQKGGYYKTTLNFDDGTSLVVAAINTCLWYEGNEVILVNNDPASQFEFLEQLLSDARAASQKVLLLGHVPPGVQIHQKYNPRFVQILQNYADVIIAGIYGHNHEDGYLLTYSADGSTPVGMGFTSPSILPSVDPRNPAYRIFSFDTAAGSLTDFYTYIADIDKSNSNGRLDYFLEYSAREAFGLDDVTPASLADLWQRMNNNETLHEQYCLYYRASYTGDGSDITKHKCSKQLCMIRYLDKDEYDDCAK